MRAVIFTAAISVAMTSATVIATGPASAAPPGTTGTTTVPLRPIYRACDYSAVFFPGAGLFHGSATSVIRRAGSTVSADVRLQTAEPNMHYDVGLIQAPHPSSATCGPGDPGAAFASLNTDGAGNGATTVQSGLGSGTTGVWVMIQRPSEHSQDPAEFYSSDFIAPV